MSVTRDGSVVDGRVARVGAAVLAIEAAAVGTYLAFAAVTITDPLILLYPLIWINVGLWAIWRADPPPVNRRRQLAVGLLAVGYFGVLAAVGGMVELAAWTQEIARPTGWRIAYATVPPGIGPAVLYSGSVVTLAVLPYQLVGYAALAYLVYATVLEAAGSALSGLVGLFSCVSCAWPVVGTVLAGLFGSGSAVYSVAISQSYGLSTVVFVSAILLLRWRPDF